MLNRGKHISSIVVVKKYFHTLPYFYKAKKYKFKNKAKRNI